MVSCAAIDPAPAGAARICSVQLAPGLIDVPCAQPANCENWASLTPTANIDSGALPLLVTVMLCAAELAPVATVPNSSCAGTEHAYAALVPEGSPYWQRQPRRSSGCGIARLL